MCLTSFLLKMLLDYEIKITIIYIFPYVIYIYLEWVIGENIENK
jgi:hypothetical protein